MTAFIRTCTDRMKHASRQGKKGRALFVPVFLLACALVLSFMVLPASAKQPAKSQPQLSAKLSANFARALPGLNIKDFNTIKLYKKAAVKEQYKAGMADLSALKADAKRSRWREPWEKLRDGFLSLVVSDPKNAPAAEALFQAASCQKTLADCSKAKTDYKLAASLFTVLSARYPQSSMADEALLAAASISASQLNNPKEAQRLLEQHLKSYPQRETAKTAKKMLADVKKGSKPAAYAAAAEDQAAGQEQTSPAPKASGKKGAKEASKAQKGTAAKESAPKTKPASPVFHANGKPYGVTIDAGHGGHDPGTVHNDLLERDITLDVALRLGRKLQQAGVKVLYTRTSNKYVSLADRTRMANQNRSDLFLSVHVNAHPNKTASGLEIYYLDTTQTCGNAVADRENGAHGKMPSMRVSAKQATLTSHMLQSRKLAFMVNNGLAATVSDSGFAQGKKAIRKGPFFVLAATTMPSVLAEIGYISNSQEAALLKKTAYRQALADGLACGILNWCRADSGAAGVVAQNSKGAGRSKAVR